MILGPPPALRVTQSRDGPHHVLHAWDIHSSLFPVVQRVLNPPFINPHLPKMYRICRELVPYLKSDEIAPLVGLEVTEYARGPKLEDLPKAKLMDSPVSFHEIEAAIRHQDRESTAALMAAFHARRGAGLCEHYKGNYNPHDLTGLGSALWVVDRYWEQPSIAINALFQYLELSLDGIRPGG